MQKNVNFHPKILKRRDYWWTTLQMAISSSLISKPSHSQWTLLWIKLHLYPYEQYPWVIKTPHYLVLYLKLICWFLLNSCDPWANLHLFSYGQKQFYMNFLHNWDFSLLHGMEDFRKSSGDSLGVLDPEVEKE